MSTIVSSMRTRYRAKLDRPTPEPATCANSSQVRRLIAKAMSPSCTTGEDWRRMQRFSVIALAVMLVALTGALALSLSTHHIANTTSNTKFVTTFLLAREEPGQVPKEFTGTILATKRSELGFAQPGRIKRLQAASGDRVSAGAVLAELDASSIESQLAVAKSELKLAESWMKALQSSHPVATTVRRTRSTLDQSANVTYESYASTKTLVEHWQAVVKQLEVQLAQCQLRAPFNAIVTETFLSEGSVVAANRPVLKVVADNELAVKVAMPVAQVALVSSMAAYPFSVGRQKLAGSVIAVLPDVQPTEQTRDVLFQLPGLSPSDIGTPASLRIDLPTSQTGFRVPRSAVQTDKTGASFVSVIHPLPKAKVAGKKVKALARKQAVEVLQASKNWLLVRGDLQSGDRLIAVLRDNCMDQQEVRYSDVSPWRTELFLSSDEP